MKYKKDKIFYKFKDQKKVYDLITYDESKLDYYSLIKKYQNQGYYQLIINSRLMIDLIRDFQKINLTVYDIELQEDDENFYEELHKTLEGLKGNNNSEVYLKYLIQSLNLLYYDNSIEINKISLGNSLNDVIIYSNGIVVMNEDIENEIKSFLKKELQLIIQ